MPCIRVVTKEKVAGAFGRISNTAEYGAYLTGPRIVGAESHQAMDQVLAEVQGGAFVRRLMADCVMWRSAADSEKLPVRATLSRLAMP